MTRTYGMEENGALFTEEEFWEHYKFSLPDRGVVSFCWGTLPHITCDDEKIDILREKMAFIYSSPSPPIGSIIKQSLISNSTYIVLQTDPLMVRNLQTGHPQMWEGPFVVLTSSSLIDTLRPLQIIYNTMMNHLEK
jgi:hypothetical protein